MAKIRTAYVCDSCGHDAAKWLGRCPSCNEWNTFKEFRINGDTKTGKKTVNVPGLTPTLLSKIDPTPPGRHPTGIAELDRVLGGGLVPGTTILLGGEPGIGKSTLMLQVATSLQGIGLYVSGEESPGQVKNRADRLGLKQDSLKVLCETNLDILLASLEAESPDYLVIDSIQTLVAADAGSVSGTPNQLKIAGHRLTNWAKNHAVPIFLIAHVTKEGIIAGPKVIEHLVDMVLFFDHCSGDLRILRASKNRMGSVDEVGLFSMSARGLEPISDPSGLFLESRSGAPPVGSAVTAVYEGSRILLVEIQALVVPAKGNAGRVYSDRIEAARVSRIAAVLERHAGLQLSDQDIYVNIAGGLRITDTGAELAVALALASARAEKALPDKTAAVGELTLAGEIRSVPHLRRRVKAATDSGMINCLFSGQADKMENVPGNGKTVTFIREAVALTLSS